jgi:hypothetical protein
MILPRTLSTGYAWQVSGSSDQTTVTGSQEQSRMTSEEIRATPVELLVRIDAAFDGRETSLS